MKCQKCVDSGLRSTVYAPTGGFSTCMAFHPYYDEDGIYHCHDGNTHSSQWQCSQGHKWSVSNTDLCPAPNCEWNKGREPKTRWAPTPTSGGAW